MKFGGGPSQGSADPVAPARERGLKLLWPAIGLPNRTVAPARERGLKFGGGPSQGSADPVAPARERGLKLLWPAIGLPNRTVAPARERGLKFQLLYCHARPLMRRSREGAWIEIAFSETGISFYVEVAPARERGLKLIPR